MKHFTKWLDEGKGADGCEWLTKALLLNDGTVLSIQASEYGYCKPRKNLASYALYWEFEVGFPSRKIDILMPYAESPDIPTETVYAYVPKGVIEQLIIEAGGVKSHRLDK